jgi:uncharacterized protein
VTEIDWDAANRDKCRKHGLSLDDVEYVLLHAETLIVPDERNSQFELRFIAIGRTKKNRYAFVVFTPRERSGQKTMRPISARFMHRKEIKKYEKEIPHTQN